MSATDVYLISPEKEEKQELDFQVRIVVKHMATDVNTYLKELKQLKTKIRNMHFDNGPSFQALIEGLWLAARKSK